MRGDGTRQDTQSLSAGQNFVYTTLILLLLHRRHRHRSSFSRGFSGLDLAQLGL
jgi:hypothetical protein